MPEPGTTANVRPGIKQDGMNHCVAEWIVGVLLSGMVFYPREVGEKQDSKEEAVQIGHF